MSGKKDENVQTRKTMVFPELKKTASSGLPRVAMAARGLMVMLILISATDRFVY
jgi:hypothetical protein